MTLQFIALTQSSIPKAFLKRWFGVVAKELKKSGHELPDLELNLVFVSSRRSRALNKMFRNKDYATDVLSFKGAEPGVFGELVFCVPVLRLQAKENKQSYQKELAYMFLHGILHLLGFEHEKGGVRAKKMYELQDQIFDKIDKV